MKVQYALLLVLAALTLALAGNVGARKSSFRMMSEISPLQTADRLLEANMNYTNPYDSFAPTKSMNIALAMSSTRQLPSNSSTFIKALLITPIIFFALGLAALVFMTCGVCFRKCYFCYSCLPSSISDDERAGETNKKLKSRRVTLFVVFYLFCLLALVANLCTFIGNADIMRGKGKGMQMIMIVIRYRTWSMKVIQITCLLSVWLSVLVAGLRLFIILNEYY